MPDVFPQIESAKRSDIYLIDPRDVEMDPDLNGRAELPDISNFLRDFRDPKVGQIQPITIRKKLNKPFIVDGISRWRAALELTNLGEGPFEGGVYKIQCKYFVGSDLDCFVATIKANIRNEPKREDNAHNISILLHNFKLSMEDIAGRVYGRFTLDNKPDVRWIKDQLALEDLAPESMAAFKSGLIKPNAALLLASMAVDIQRQKLAELQESGRKITVANIRRELQATMDNQQPSPAVQQGGGVKPAPAKFGRPEACALVQEFIDMDYSGLISIDMTPENAVMTVLGDLLSKMEGK